MKIVLDHIYKSFYGRESVLAGVNAEFVPGQLSVIFGRSGSGKSTLLSCMAGLETFEKGAVFYQQQSLKDLSASKRADFRLANIGFVYQFFHLISSLRVFENILLPAHLLKRQAENRAQELMQLFDISSLKDVYTDTLSGGEKQRVAMCRALITDPPVILADEPTGNLDVTNRDQVIHYLHDIAKKMNKTVIIVTHDEGFKAIADQAFCLSQGTLNLL